MEEQNSPRSNEDKGNTEHLESNGSQNSIIDDDFCDPDVGCKSPDIYTEFNIESDTIRFYSGSKPPSRAFSRVTSIRKLPPLVTSPELDSENNTMLKDFMEKGKIPLFELRERLFQHIQRCKVNALVDDKYDRAAKLQILSQKLLDQLLASDTTEKNNGTIEILSAKLGEIEKRIDEENMRTDHLVSQAISNFKNKQEALLKKHENEILIFEDNWNDPLFLKPFAKPSQQLIKLKSVEQKLVIQKLFNRAEETKKMIEQMENQESEIAQKKAYEIMETQKEKLLEKHKQEFGFLNQHFEKVKIEIQLSQRTIMKSLIARQRKLKNEIDGMKNSIRSCKTTNKSTEQIQLVMTPRTATRYGNYKSSMNPPKLRVKPLGAIVPKKNRIQ